MTTRILDGNGPLDARLTIDQDEIDPREVSDPIVILNIATNNGEHSAGINLNRIAIVDLIGMLAKALAEI